MGAVWSGQIGAVAFLEGADARLFRAEDVSKHQRLRREEVGYVFDGASDVQYLKGAREADALAKMVAQWNGDRALRLLLILLSTEEESDTRVAAAHCLEELLSNEYAQEYIECELLARPLPRSLELDLLNRPGFAGGSEP